jgi:hypothetical protein
MDPLTLGLIGIPGATKSVVGLLQYLEGRKQARATRPLREIPDEIFQNLNQAEIQALEGMPMEQRQRYVQDIQRGSQSALRAMGDRRAGIAGIPQIYQKELDSYGNLAGQDAMMRMQNQDRLAANRMEMARQKDTQFQLNEYEPFLNKMRLAEGLIGAGMQNFMGGMTDTSKMAIDYDLYDRYMGGKGLSFGNNKTVTPKVNAPANTLQPNQQPVNNLNNPIYYSSEDMMDNNNLGAIVPDSRPNYNWYGG